MSKSDTAVRAGERAPQSNWPTGQRSTALPAWITKRNRTAPLRVIAGYGVRLDADRFAPDIPPDDAVRWVIAGQQHKGRSIDWVPHAPGLYKARLGWTGGERVVSVSVGVNPRDCVHRRRELDCMLALIVRRDWKLHVIPLLGEKREPQSRDADARLGKAAKAARKELRKEVDKGHPAFAELMRAQTATYARRIRPRPFFDLRAVPDGLYAIFPRDAVYLGSAAPVARATQRIAEKLVAIAATATGRGALLKEIEAAVRGIDPEAYEYADEPWFRDQQVRGPVRVAPEVFLSGAFADMVGAVTRFSADVGVRDDLGGNGPTAIVTFNGGNGVLSTRVFDSMAGFSRQVTSGLQIPGMGDLGKGDVTGSVLDDFGRGLTVTNGIGGLGSRANFGSSLTSLFGGLGGLVSGSGAMSGGTGQAAMDGDGAGIGDRPGYDSDGHFYVKGDDGSTVGFRYGSDGNPEPNHTETDADGNTVVYGDVTIIDFGEDEGGGDDSGGDTDGGDGGDEGGGTDGGTEGGGTDGGDEGGGTDGGTEGGGTDGGDEGGGTDGGDEGGGTDGGDDGEAPGGSEPEAGMPNPDDTSGGGDGNEGGGPRVGGRGGGRRRVIIGASCGIITRGGGYTDPVDDPAAGGSTGGTIRVIPGGGVTDPPDGEGMGGGFDYWGGYNAPIGNESDPLVNPARNGYSSISTGGRRSITTAGNVRFESFSGPGAGGAGADGLFSAGMVAGPASQNRDGGDGTSDPSNGRP